MSKTVRAAQREISVDDIARVAGLASEDFEPRHGWSNQAWIGSQHVVRASSGRLRGSLAHEADVIRLVTRAGLPVAQVLSLGSIGDLPGQRGEAGEWLVSRRLPGETLAAVWPSLGRAERVSVGRQLGELLRTIHRIDTEPVAPPWWIDAHEPPNLRNAYRPNSELGPLLVDAARGLPDADTGLLDTAEGMLHERLPLFAGDRAVLVHSDIHGHNLLVEPGAASITGVLDWEGAHTAPADVELDMLLRWTAAAHDFPESPAGSSLIEPGDCLMLIDSVADTYPDLFRVANLKERLEVYDAHWHLVQLLFDRYWRDQHPPAGTEPSPTWDRLRQLLDGRSHLNAFKL